MIKDSASKTKTIIEREESFETINTQACIMSHCFEFFHIPIVVKLSELSEF